jgi:UDPglucose 6-dehydrogenase
MARIIIVGSGVVGFATGQGFLRLAHDVTFVDINPERVESLTEAGFTATADVDIQHAPESFIILTLPTPHTGRRYDLDAFVSGVTAVGEAIARSRGYHTVIVRSTVPPGTCEELVRPTLEEASGQRVGEGFTLASAPEFLRAASALEDFLSPWMTLIASKSRRTVERVESLFRPFGGEVRTYNDPAIAEMIKCTHNVFNAAKISFWNEVWMVCERLGLSSTEVASAVARSAEGSTNIEYGIRGGKPYGGACLPKDVAGFLGLGDRLELRLHLTEAVAAVNAAISEQARPGGIDIREAAAQASATANGLR